MTEEHKKLKPRWKYLLLVLIVATGSIGVAYSVIKHTQTPPAVAISAEEAQKIKLADNIEKILANRREEETKTGESTDPFGDDDVVKILLLGLDSRTGETAGHCDAIQFLTINRKTETVQITAVPRGTYSPLPGPIMPTGSYYVSNACAIVGLDYGIKQIEKILGDKPDYLVMVGFSKTLGILRQLQLPTTETLQWLRQRQGYAIGEPQRARNHSTFIKELLAKYSCTDQSTLNATWEYLIYKMVKTDLSFDQASQILIALSKMELDTQSEKISLAMRPAYAVQDIPYDPATADAYVHSMIDPIKERLQDGSFVAVTPAEAEARILDYLKNNIDKPDFQAWAFDNQLWLQLEDEMMRDGWHYEIINKYTTSLKDTTKAQEILADYILEMDFLGQKDWSAKGRALLAEELGATEHPDIRRGRLHTEQ